MPEQPGRDRRPFGQGGVAFTSADPPTGRGTVGCAKPGRGFGRLGAPVFPTATARQHTSLPSHTSRQTVPNDYDLPTQAANRGEDPPVYPKSPTLRGFKSFASPTPLRLEPGITCVPGPNASAKSNGVEALAWVMGE